MIQKDKIVFKNVLQKKNAKVLCFFLIKLFLFKIYNQN